MEQAFVDSKSTFETRPLFHQQDDTIRGHVFSSFLAPVLRRDLHRRLEAAGYSFERSGVKQDLSALQKVVIEDRGRCFAVRTQCLGTGTSVFRAVGIAIPPTIRLLDPWGKICSANKSKCVRM